ncbi:hypothetical protein EDB83DRAFT_2384257 [Lactarius deliciosus]|nr:hypothetical protein EDB83DRAFT_2384257 [Lactarius deliciosus]
MMNIVFVLSTFLIRFLASFTDCLRSLRLVTIVFHHRVSFVLRLFSFHQLMILPLTFPLLLLLYTVSSTLKPRT